MLYYVLFRFDQIRRWDQCAVYILYSKISIDPGLLKIRHSHRFVAVVIQFLIQRAFSVLILIKWHYEQFSCFLVGTNRATLVEMNVLHPVGIVVFGDYVYWIDRETRTVMKIKKGGELLGSAVQVAVDDLSDIIVVDGRKSTGRNIILILK